MTTLRISITKEVLEATKDCELKPGLKAQNCAIAYAVREIWSHSFTFYDQIKIIENGKNYYVEHDANKFIYRFDRATPAERAAMQPFSFDIEVPDEVIGEVNIEEIRRICEGSKTLELVN